MYICMYILVLGTLVQQCKWKGGPYTFQTITSWQDVTGKTPPPTPDHVPITPNTSVIILWKIEESELSLHFNHYQPPQMVDKYDMQ